jgi:hypothetical protein
MKRVLPWAVAGVAAVGLLAAFCAPRAGQASIHPDPRPGITAEGVMPSGMVPPTPGALEAYEAARRVPQVLDGLYCHCDCSKYFGHRSLLTCYESEHGARCDICMGEAMLAARLAAEGNSLAKIRSAIDAQFGS